MHKLCVLFILLYSTSLFSNETLALQVETGYVWQHRNDVRITPSTGDFVEFDKFDRGPFFHYRAEVFWKFAKRHGLRLIFAPFGISVTGQQKASINFNETVFAANQDVTVDYMFNSYRIGYYYSLIEGKRHQFNIGLTGKIRHAEIKFSQGSTSKSYDNVGFVPLLYVSYLYRLGQRWYFSSDADFAAAPQGRAFDVALKLRYLLSKSSSLGIGYRTLEGGADNDKVYTFSWFNYFLIDLKIKI